MHAVAQQKSEAASVPDMSTHSRHTTHFPHSTYHFQRPSFYGCSCEGCTSCATCKVPTVTGSSAAQAAFTMGIICRSWSTSWPRRGRSPPLEAAPFKVQRRRVLHQPLPAGGPQQLERSAPHV
ncbi:hypothetical protein E2C01_046837 [Portunus trituberculatus]|uniref:Uncharacterized protein n=1 Tax=Portunus trituberculatus TaxID=210409 RepID=A0A5B7G640_PORTR|nr:hypothetical protein [Portunus trituberculatus]